MSPMATASRTYGGVSVDRRRATRRAALIEAALDLFGEVVRRRCPSGPYVPARS